MCNVYFFCLIYGFTIKSQFSTSSKVVDANQQRLSATWLQAVFSPVVFLPSKRGKSSRAWRSWSRSSGFNPDVSFLEKEFVDPKRPNYQSQSFNQVHNQAANAEIHWSCVICIISLYLSILIWQSSHVRSLWRLWIHSSRERHLGLAAVANLWRFSWESGIHWHQTRQYNNHLWWNHWQDTKRAQS